MNKSQVEQMLLYLNRRMHELGKVSDQLYFAANDMIMKGEWQWTYTTSDVN
jgi:hypothetical protein